MAVTSLSADLASGMKRVNEMKTALKEILNFAGLALLTFFIMVIALFFYERSKGADIDFDVLGVRGTGGSGGSEYEVTLKNSSSKRLTVYTYLRTGDGFQFCPTQHNLRANSTSRDTVVCDMFQSITYNKERFEIYAVLKLPDILSRDLSIGRTSGKVVGFR